MIARLSGTVISLAGEDPVVLDVHGVGYAVHTPRRISRACTPETKITLHIHTHVREDAFELFGFLSGEELQLFILLLNVSGIGPRTALGVLDHEASAIRRAIESGDVDFFTAVPRLGKKNAQKIIIELRSKLTGATGALPEDETGETKALTDALVSMGFDRKEIRSAIRGLPDGTLEARIRHALKSLGKR